MTTGARALGRLRALSRQQLVVLAREWVGIMQWQC
jgi:hypothetical protein